MAIIYSTSEVKSDLEMAKKILRGETDISYESKFNPYSFIYKSTNEVLNEYDYHFIGKKKMLSVIGSGDQIINAILRGVEEVEAFDISKLPKYFLALKIAAIKALSLDEYIDFFYADDYYKPGHFKRDFKHYLNFVKICKYLDPPSLEFWVELLNKSSWHNVYNSKLFSEYVLKLQNEIEKNGYLRKINYDKLKSIISASSINVKTGNILDLIDTYDEKDLIYLSNIKDYMGLDKYISLLKSLKLTDNGEAISYCFDMLSFRHERKLFEDNGCICEDLPSKDAIIIYHKRP